MAGIVKSLDIMSVKAFLARFGASAIPRKEFEYVFSRSSGAGGQNVNKVNTKATIKYSAKQWSEASWVPADARALVTKANFPYFTKSGSIIVSSELTRHQRANLDDCFDKLAEAIKQASTLPDDPSQEAQQRWVKLRNKEDTVRKERKKLHSAKKQSRKEKF